MKQLFSIIAIFTGLTVFGQTWHPDSGAKFPGATEVNELTTQKILLIGEYNLVNSFIEADSLLQAYATKTYVQSNFATDEQGALADTALQPGDNNSGLVNDSGYLTSEANDLTQSVIWKNVPDANITQSSVTQHEAALSISQSQIPDLQHVTNNNELTNGAGYLINEVDPTTPAHVKAISTTDITNWNAAEPNVNADWDASSGDAEILNKPTTVDGYGITDANLQTIIENGAIASIIDPITIFSENINIEDGNFLEVLNNGSIKVNNGELKVSENSYLGVIENGSFEVQNGTGYINGNLSIIGTLNVGGALNLDTNTALSINNNNGAFITAEQDTLIKINEKGLLKLFGGITSNDGNFNEYFGKEAFGNKFAFQSPYSNTAVGAYAMYGNPIGTQNGLVHSNTAIGLSSLLNIRSGIRNVAIGAYAMYGADDSSYGNQGDANVAVGVAALQNNTTGRYNIGFGFEALWSNKTGVNNLALGSRALAFVQNPDRNIAIGTFAMEGDTLFSYQEVTRNIALGIGALRNIVDGENNTAIGHNAATNLSTGSYNTYIGSVDASSATVSNEVIIGDGQGNVVFKADGFSQHAEIPGNLKVGGLRLSDLNNAPVSATDTGNKGEVRITATHIYVCIATDTWVRAALSTW